MMLTVTTVSVFFVVSAIFCCRSLMRIRSASLASLIRFCRSDRMLAHVPGPKRMSINVATSRSFSLRQFVVYDFTGHILCAECINFVGFVCFVPVGTLVPFEKCVYLAPSSATDLYALMPDFICSVTFVTNAIPARPGCDGVNHMTMLLLS